ncbi:Heat shock 70 kDa protein 12A [Mortierella sp. AD094]|nr:Heat shock 70 kDa protein 12A [Mortierella sp. AD094]
MFPKSVIQTLVETFAHQLRPQFDGEEDQYLRLSEGDRFDDIRDPSSIGIEDGYMCLKASELKKVVFEPAVKQVLTLIREQLKGAKKCSAIFMVSEFGSSSYLMDRVKQDFGGRVKTISSPYKPGFAVVCGAVYAGLDQKRATARIDTDSHFTDLDFDPNDYPIVVAIDFGTTFSPKQDFHYAKTPTLNLYQEVDGECRMVEWGWKSKLKMKTPAASKYIQLSQYKPYLDESLILASWNNKVSVPNAISDYLNAIHEYVAEKILKDFGPSKSRKSFRYCLTVPAMWSDKAKDVMRKAAIRAGLITDADHPDRLVLVSEPEAAALYCEKACKQYDLGHGDQFMICDAGGGTVDLIVYEIASTSQGQHLSEVTKGHGASCGSIFIDLNFSNLLVKKFEGQGADIPKNVIQTLVETFAYQLKPQFDGDEELYLTIPRDNCFDDIKDPGSIGIKGGYMYLDPSELKKVVFEPVVKQVLGLIQGQLCSAKDCSAIFMVGGFGSSSYLLDRVEQEFGGRVKTISAPYKPEMAVVCGAVYVGLNPKMVTARVTRRCYGTHIYTDFEEGIDPERLKLERLDGTWCKGRFDAFVRKGQKVQVDECVTKSYGIAKYKNSQVDRSVGIYAIDGNPPRYITDVGISELAKISVPDPFKPSDPIGRRVDVEMKMYFGLNEIRTEIFIQGKKYLMELKFDGGDSY